MIINLLWDVQIAAFTAVQEEHNSRYIAVQFAQRGNFTSMLLLCWNYAESRRNK